MGGDLPPRLGNLLFGGAYRDADAPRRRDADQRGQDALPPDVVLRLGLRREGASAARRLSAFEIPPRPAPGPSARERARILSPLRLGPPRQARPYGGRRVEIRAPAPPHRAGPSCALLCRSGNDAGD